MNIFTYSKQLFDAITKGKRTTEKSVTIYVIAAREAYKKFKIQNIGLICGEDNPAEDLSKLGGNGAILNFMSGKDNTEVVEWIIQTTLLRGQSWECELPLKLTATV